MKAPKLCKRCEGLKCKSLPEGSDQCRCYCNDVRTCKTCMGWKGKTLPDDAMDFGSCYCITPQEKKALQRAAALLPNFTWKIDGFAKMTGELNYYSRNVSKWGCTIYVEEELSGWWEARYQGQFDFGAYGRTPLEAVRKVQRRLDTIGRFFTNAAAPQTRRKRERSSIENRGNGISAQANARASQPEG